MGVRFLLMGLSIALAVATVAQGADPVLPLPDPGPMNQSKALDLHDALTPGTASFQGTAGGRNPAPDLQSGPPSLFRDVPSISGRYSVGGTTLLPFVAAGFNGGYTERDRALNPVAGMPEQPGLRSQWSQFGQGMAPNEFQMGVRIPF